MGWNTVEWTQDHALSAGVEPEARYYFVHTYAVEATHPEHVLAKAAYGIPFDACLTNGNVIGTQFHPEKSHRFGMSLMKRFLEFTPASSATAP